MSLLTIYILVLCTLLSTLFLLCLFNRGREALKIRLMGGWFANHDKILAFIQTLPGRTDGSQLLEELHELLLKALCINSYKIVLLDETAHYLKVFRSHPQKPTGSLSEFNRGSHIYHYFRKTERPFLSKTSGRFHSDSPLELSKARQQMEDYEAECCFAFRFQKTCFGFILLGPKMNGAPYTLVDLQLIERLVRKLSNTINQIRLMNQLLQIQEEELLGRMSRGMAHDLNNLLTPINTYLQLAAENGATPFLNEELLAMAMNNLQTMHAYIQESLFFSQNQKPDFKNCELAPLIESSVRLMCVKLEAKRINVRTKIPTELRIDLDEVLIQRLFTNLISNAADASYEGAEILITAIPFDPENDKDNWLRIQGDRLWNRNS